MYNKVQETREPLFSVERGGVSFRCELIQRGEREWFVDLFTNGEYDHRVGGPFDSAEAARIEAEKERDAINRGELDGW